MQCNRVTQALESSNGDSRKLAPELQQHLARCEDCRAYAEERRLDALLLALPVPEAPEGFAEAALAHAWTNRDVGTGQRWVSPRNMLALAASLVLAVGVLFQTPGQQRANDTQQSTPEIVSVTPAMVNTVDVLMVSSRALPDASITLQLDDNVSLAGYPGQRELRWVAALSAGNNQLSLPVQLQGEGGGNVSIEVRSNGASKRLLFTVAASEQPSLAMLTI